MPEFVTRTVSNPSQNLQDRILDRFRREGPGAVLSPRDLLDLGSGPAARQALSRAVDAGLIQKVARGLYQNRAYQRGECVGLFAQAPVLCGEIQATIVEVLDQSLRVRVLQDVLSMRGECVVRRGDEFVVSRSNVFSVRFSA